MNRPLLPRFLAWSLTLCLGLLPQALQACATCYGASDAPMARGMNWGIMTLLVVIGGVLAGIASFFIYLAWRSSRHPMTPATPNSN